MICPHCHKAISFNIPKEALKLAKKYRQQGYSLREIEKLLFKYGYKASASALCRALKPEKLTAEGDGK